jgi:hypothetical protein
MIVIKETVQRFQHGQRLVGVTAVKITDSTFRFAKGILLRTAGDNDPTPNTDVIWVGDARVTSSDGMPIAPGESINLPLESAENLYAISTSANQSIAWLGC